MRTIRRFAATVLTASLLMVSAASCENGSTPVARPENGPIPIELSARHVHLSEKDCLALFGGPLTFVRELSQPGQFLAKERVRLIGPKAYPIVISKNMVI